MSRVKSGMKNHYSYNEIVNRNRATYNACQTSLIKEKVEELRKMGAEVNALWE